MNVLSLFNGMSFGMMALESLDIKVNKYYSSEIDKYATQATQTLFPNTIQLGDVTKWQDWEFVERGFDLGGIDLLLAGFPCQAWSMAGKQKGDNDPRGALVHDLINIWTQINSCRKVLGKKPVKFMFENVKMKKEFLDYINNLFGVEPICINSALVSAQNRVRYYWTNIEGVEQPEDRGVLLKDIIGPGQVDRDKSYCIDANYHKGGNLKSYFEKRRRQLVFLSDESRQYRKLTPRECFRLQTVPEHYIDTLLNSGELSNTNLYKMCGNGWTHNVIAHIFKNLK